MKKCWVDGIPATFATKGEIPWRNTIIGDVSLDNPFDISGVDLDFKLPTLAPRGHPFDTDNLCEPVFYALKKIGYFGGKNSNILWWRARKSLGDPSGVWISLKAEKPNDLGDSLGAPIFSYTYCGELPKSATSPEIPEWITTLPNIKIPESDARLALSLKFGASKVSLGNITTGRVKSFIDCLYPIIGGRKGAPDDWKIDLIQAEKDALNRNPDCVTISIWKYGAGDSV